MCPRNTKTASYSRIIWINTQNPFNFRNFSKIQHQQTHWKFYCNQQHLECLVSSIKTFLAWNLRGILRFHPPQISLLCLTCATFVLWTWLLPIIFPFQIGGAKCFRDLEAVSRTPDLKARVRPLANLEDGCSLLTKGWCWSKGYLSTVPGTETKQPSMIWTVLLCMGSSFHQWCCCRTTAEVAQSSFPLLYPKPEHDAIFPSCLTAKPRKISAVH